MGKILEALDVAGALFPVDKVGLVLSHNFNSLDEYRAVVRTDTGEALGVVGSEFGLISHRKAFSGLDEALPQLEAKLGEATVVAETYRRKKRGTGGIYTGAIADLRIEFRSSLIEEGLFPTLHLTHGIAGEASLTAQAGVFRLVCSNGMIAGDRELVKRLRHTASIRYKLEGLEALALRAVERSAAVAGLIRAASTVPLKYEDEDKAVRYLLTGSTEEKDRKPRGYDEARDLLWTAPGADGTSANGILQLGTYLATNVYGRGNNPLHESMSTGADRLRQRANLLAKRAVELDSVSEALLALSTN